MIAFRALRNLPGIVQANMLAAVVAAKRAGIADFSAAVKTGTLILVFEFAKIKPGFIGSAGDQIDKPVFDQRQVKTQPILDLFALLVQCTIGLVDVAAQRIAQGFRFFLREGIEFTRQLLSIVDHFIHGRGQGFLSLMYGLTDLLDHMVVSGDQLFPILEIHVTIINASYRAHKFDEIWVGNTSRTLAARIASVRFLAQNSSSGRQNNPKK